MSTLKDNTFIVSDIVKSYYAGFCSLSMVKHTSNNYTNFIYQGVSCSYISFRLVDDLGRLVKVVKFNRKGKPLNLKVF